MSPPDTRWGMILSSFTYCKEPHECAVGHANTRHNLTFSGTDKLWFQRALALTYDQLSVINTLLARLARSEYHFQGGKVQQPNIMSLDNEVLVSVRFDLTIVKLHTNSGCSVPCHSTATRYPRSTPETVARCQRLLRDAGSYSLNWNYNKCIYAHGGSNWFFMKCSKYIEKFSS
ncbi:hypothetical protein FN846DRAFT_903491 [Sphaerosporella brunnea]|uniref:Uncharacterized protein n=1 Tax=Sphaerosporella brunnea TaxID=1250544 RepID=A0A5J5F721_9PEZI|nr:hypothetical protein FN846DRAFT_903491 [Sphaerosporella brunnea]